MKPKYIITISALLYIGAASLITQIVLIRELIIAFYGNELFLGLALALWLISTGLGSLYLSRIFKRKLENIIAWFYLIFPLLLLSAFFLVRLSRAVLASGGVVPNLFIAFLWSVLVIAPTALCLGVLFVILAKTFNAPQSKSVTYAYIIESLGFLVGALVFNFWLFNLPSLTLFLLFASLSLTFSFLYSFEGSPLKSVIAIVLLVISFFTLNQTSSLDKYTNSWHYPGELMFVSEQTKFNSVHITRLNEQYNFYLNGQLITNTQNTYVHELITHLPLLLATSSPNVLLIGNGFTGILEEINKYHPQNLVYLELDNDYFRFAQDLLEYRSPTSTIIKHADARSYLSLSSLSFDIVIINFSNPATLAENRYFTHEFFSHISSNLTPSGLLVLNINTAPNYTVGAHKDLLASLYQALQQTFVQVLALPENEIIFLASNRPIIYSQDLVDKRYKDLNLNNQYFFPSYISWRFSNDRTQTLNQQLASLSIPPNSDLKPTLYYHQLKIFLEKMNVANYFKPIGLAMLLIFIIATIFLLLQPTAYRLLPISALPEFCLISFEVLLILLFQTYHGFLYTQLSLIIALILFGIALGSLLSHWLLQMSKTNLTSLTNLIKLSFILITLSFAFPLLFTWLFPEFLKGQTIYYLFSLLPGFAIGTKFPIINKLYLQKSTNIGAVYGVDLISGALGALLAGTILLPVLGVILSLALFVLLSLVSLLLIQTKPVSY